LYFRVVVSSRGVEGEKLGQYPAMGVKLAPSQAKLFTFIPTL
jgi:hypothetical protein